MKENLRCNGHLNDYKRVDNIFEALRKIEMEIPKSDWKKLDDIDRCLAVLMQEAKERKYKLNGIKHSARAFQLGKKLKLIGKYGESADDRFLDHCSKISYDDKEFFVSEPYNLGLESMQKIIDFCKKYNVGVIIDGDSSYFTGRTLRIRFCKREKEKEVN